MGNRGALRSIALQVACKRCCVLIVALLVTHSGSTVFAQPSDTVENAGDAARFLAQASFGPSAAEIDQLVALGSYQAWLDQQFSAPITGQEPAMRLLNDRLCGNPDAGDAIARHQVWWETALNGPDQLRQRVAFALSQILVVSDQHAGIKHAQQFGLANYYDVLASHAYATTAEGCVRQHPR